jgi:hypothetical protein
LSVQPHQVYLYKGCGDFPTTDILQATFTTSQGPLTRMSTQSTLPVSRIPPLSASPTVIQKSAAASATSSTSPSTASSPGQQRNVGAIVGGVLGGIVLVCFVALAVLFLRKRRGGNPQLPAFPEEKPFWRHKSHKRHEPAELAS